MKKIVTFALAVLLVLCTASCSAKKQEIQSDNKGPIDVSGQTEFNLNVKGDASPFDLMSENAFRKEIRPYLEAWYEFCYRGMWGATLELSSNGATYEDENGNTYIKAKDFNTSGELSEYLSNWIHSSAFVDALEAQTYEDESGLYLSQISTGWYGEPDYYTCKYVGTKDSTYYVKFTENTELSEEGEVTHIVAFKKINKRLLVTGSLTTEEGLELTVEKTLSRGIAPNLMSISEFKDFVSLLLYRHIQTTEYINFTKSSIRIVSEREWMDLGEGVDLVAEVLINEMPHYVFIGTDINGNYNIVRIQKI